MSQTFLRKCIVVGCCQTFWCYSSYNSHLLRKHKGKYFEDEARKTLLCSGFYTPEERTVNTSLSPSKGPSETTAADVLPVDYMETAEVNDEGEIVDPSLMQDCLCTSDRLHRSAALLLLDAKECHQLTQSALCFIIHQIQQMFSFAVEDIDEMVKKYSTAQGTLGNIPELEAHLEAMHSPFSRLETEYCRLSFIGKILI